MITAGSKRILRTKGEFRRWVGRVDVTGCQALCQVAEGGVCVWDTELLCEMKGQ